MRLIIAAILMAASIAPATAQTKCYTVNGKTTCCTTTGSYTYCG